MKINKISKDLYEIEDFINEEQQRAVIDFLNSLSEEDWNLVPEGASDDYKGSLWYGRQFHGSRPEVFDDIERSVNDLYDSKSSEIPIAIQRYRKDDYINEHRDYWIYELPYHIRYGVCIYYNDDYEGGELEYSELGIIHKPKARSLVMHGGNILHKSLPVKNDIVRYFSTAFVHGTKDVPVVLNEGLFKDIHEEDGSKYESA